MDKSYSIITIMKNTITLLVLVVSFFALVSSVKADCGGQYNQPCQAYSILVDKMVGKPGGSNDANSYNYVDNLGLSDPRFNPDQVVFFKVKVKNTSTTKLVSVDVRDTVP